MVKISDFSFPSSDGVHHIRCRRWEPEGTARAVVHLVHGVAEHIERYHEFASFLAEHGYAVAGDDHLGHGKSISDGSELGWFSEEDGWKHLVEDEKKLRDILRERFPGVPMVLFGHSMGSFMARTYLGWYPQDFDACVLSGTGRQPGIVCRAGKLLARLEINWHGSKYRSSLLQKAVFGGYLKRVENPTGPNDWVCRDAEVIRKYDTDPLCGYIATVGLMYDMMDGMQLIGKSSHMAKMDKAKPVLFIAGDADPVGNYGKGVKQVAEGFIRAGMQDISVKLYPDFRHEILNEFGKEQVCDDVLHWLEEKI